MKRFTRILVLLGVVITCCSGVIKAAPPCVNQVKVATIHFCPELGNVARNVRTLLALNTEAARNGAKIIVNTEMATSGYAFFSRAELAKVAEPIPGPTTAAFGQVAQTYGVYIVLGMAEYDPQTNLYYNAAVLLTPEGKVAGTYRKRSNLLESSYNAINLDPLPTFDTPYGRLAMAICADVFYPQIPRLAAIKGVDILAVPMNSGVEVNQLQVLTYENDFSLIVANRFGTEIKGEVKHVFNQNTFTIPSPYEYSFDYGSRSVIIDNNEKLLAEIDQPANAIGYGMLPIAPAHALPVQRRPQLYSLLCQDTLQPYLVKQMGLPPAAIFTAAAVDPLDREGSWERAIAAMENAVQTALLNSLSLRLIVLPADYFNQPAPEGVVKVKEFAAKYQVDVVMHFGKAVPPQSLLITPSGETYSYYRTHKTGSENIPTNRLSDEFLVIDRDYGRLALLQDRDLLAPETGIVLAKMGVDVVAVNGSLNEEILSALWQARTGNYLHIIVANLNGKEGIYFGGYRTYPAFEEAEGLVIRELNTADVRSKAELRFFDATPLVK